MIAWLRTCVFQLLFVAMSVPLVLLTPIVALFGRSPLRRFSNWWMAAFQALARGVLDVDMRVEGEIPAGPVLFAAKHQSLYETFALPRLLGSPGIVMKRELAQIPVWGWAARRYGMIVVDREASAKALRGMMRDAQATLADGRSIVIFPEGTRVVPGETPPLRAGFAGLYRLLKLPVVPVAVLSGHVWPRKGPKRPGTVVIHFGEPIPPGLPRDEVEARVHEAINRFEQAPPAEG